MSKSIYKIGVICGEQSGQLLAADLIEALQNELNAKIELVGVGGGSLQSLGLKSIFDPDEIALTGVAGVVRALPKLLTYIRKTANILIEENPDCLLLVDSPDFSLRVAKRVKSKLPDLPIIKYVAPTVWAWRPGRAAKMRTYVDHILAVLPFEPDVMRKLGGPETHYVGHRLMMDEGLTAAWRRNCKRPMKEGTQLNLLVLPGSRSSEINSLLGPFGEAVQILHDRGHDFTVSIPTLPRFAEHIKTETASWPVRPDITVERDEHIAAYRNADAALAASGTVTFELALAGVPAISCYKVDPIMGLAASMITSWSAALPNLIADRPVIREFYNNQVRPGMLARCIEQLTGEEEHSRKAVIAGYTDVRNAMKVDNSPSVRAAEIVASLLRDR